MVVRVGVHLQEISPYGGKSGKNTQGRRSAKGGLLCFAGARANGEVAPRALIPVESDLSAGFNPIAAVRRPARHRLPVTRSRHLAQDRMTEMHWALEVGCSTSCNASRDFAESQDIGVRRDTAVQAIASTRTFRAGSPAAAVRKRAGRHGACGRDRQNPFAER